MIWILTTLTFLATIAVVMVVVYGFTPGKADIAGRLAQISGVASPADETKFAQRQAEKVRDKLADLGKILPAESAKSTSRDKF